MAISVDCVVRLDCHASDIGHWLAMTVKVVGNRNGSINREWLGKYKIFQFQFP